MPRILLALLLVIAVSGICAYAWVPAVVTYAEVAPPGIEYSLDEPKSVDRALAKSVRYGREWMARDYGRGLRALTLLSVVLTAAVLYLLLRRKHAV